MLKNLIRENGFDLVIDIGANVGQFAKKIRQAGYTGEIYSFEPSKQDFASLAKSAQNDLNWKVFNFGFGEKSEFMTLNVMNNSDFSSLLPPSLAGKNIFSSKIKVHHTEKVSIQTFDDFFQGNSLKSKKILFKVDTQGYDLKVISGATSSLKYIDFILNESSFIPIYDSMPDFCEIRDQMRRSGFEVSAILPITRNSIGQIIEADTLYTRERRDREIDL